MTWTAMGIRAGGQLLILPVLARSLPQADFELWLLFSTVVSIVMMSVFGFDLTFVRMIAFVAVRSAPEGDPNARFPRTDFVKSRVGEVFYLLRRVFRYLAIAGFLLAAVGGSLAMMPAIARSSDPIEGWAAWALTSAGCGITLYGMTYTITLQGFDRIALLRRWEAIFAMGGLIAILVPVWLHPRLITVAVAWQAVGLIALLRNRYLCSRLNTDLPHSPAFNRTPRRLLWRVICPVAWRSGITNVGSHGVIQASGLAYAVIPDPLNLPGYLLSLRLFQVLHQISSVPFLTQIPRLARQRATGDSAGQLRVIRRSMRRAFTCLIFGVVAVSLFANPVFAAGNEALEIRQEVWWILGFALLCHLHSTILAGLLAVLNRVVAHIGLVLFALGTGSIAVVLTPRFKDVGLSLSILAGSIAAAGYASSRTYPFLKIDAWHFERTATIPAMVIMAIIFLGFMLLS
jgi:hypothetical protein